MAVIGWFDGSRVISGRVATSVVKLTVSDVPEGPAAG
jgi:hypothetical protein